MNEPMKELLTARKLAKKLLAALLILMVVIVVCSLIGTERISLKKVFFSADTDELINSDRQIFFRVRLARIMLAVIVGAALASCGVVFQALLRNPLAEPYILGISSGAGLGTMIAVISGVGWTLWGRTPVAIFAFAGAMGTVCIVWMIGGLTARYHITGLLLAGVVVNAFFSSVIMFLTSVAKSQQVHSTIFWLMGNMVEEEFGVLWFEGGLVAAGVAALFYLGPQLNVLSLGTEQARSVGINTGRIQFFAVMIASAITAIAVSLSGLVGFVGLIVPHTVRLIFGPDHRQLILLSAVLGGIFLILADTTARVIVAPAQLPVGVITAMAGGPVFLILLIKHSRKLGWLSK
jgi:iron complex transport system permease protein